MGHGFGYIELQTVSMLYANPYVQVLQKDHLPGAISINLRHCQLVS